MKHKLFNPILRASLLLFVCVLSSMAWSQNAGNVKGHVTDSSGEPLIGVSILVKGTTNGTVTDLDGNFTLSVREGEVLRVSYVGYAIQEVPVALGKQMRIILEEDTEVLDEVVVVGYGTQKRVNLTGAVSVVTADELASKPVMSTAQAIAGLAPGLSVVQNSGRPGTGATVKIRGTGTFSSAGTDPLVLIDGLSGSMDDVDPNDIQSISFLKDAASASIYGNRAANGVILIETKKGAQGKTTVSYSNSFGWQKATELPDFLPSWEYAEYYNMAMLNMGRQDAYSAEQIELYRNGSDPDNYPNANHLEWLLNSGSGFQHQHNISIQGGNARTSYNLSVGYRKQNGLTAETSNERLTALFTMKSELTKGLTLNLNVNAYNNKYNAPNGEPQSIDGMIGFAVREAPIYAGQKSDGTFGYQDNYSPEAWLAGESFIENIGRNVSASAQLRWETPVKGLSISGKGGFNYYTKYDKAYRAETYFDENKTVGPSSLNIWSGNNTYTTMEALINYERTIKKHDFKILLGTSAEQSVNRELSGYRNTFPNNFLYELGSGDASTATNGSTLEEYALLSFFGRVNYVYDDRYLLEANLRYDGSSRFAPGKQWGVFPSFSVGWNINRENFMSQYEFIDNLKLRLSWGQLGNAEKVGLYLWFPGVDSGAYYNFDDKLVFGTRPSKFANTDLTWETTTSYNLGLDGSFFNGKLSFEVDLWKKTTNDVLLTVPISTVIGAPNSNLTVNAGKIGSHGFDLTLGSRGNITKDLSYNATFTLTGWNSWVVDLRDRATAFSTEFRPGEELGNYYGYECLGIINDEKVLDEYKKIENVAPQTDLGDLMYKDQNGDGRLDYLDNVKLGNYYTKNNFGLNLGLGYKGFDLQVFFQGAFNVDKQISGNTRTSFLNFQSPDRNQLDRWTEENRNADALYPRLRKEYSHNTDPLSSWWIKSASYIKLKNLQIGYSFPESFTSKIRVKNLRLYLSGTNLFTIAPDFLDGYDPEGDMNPNIYPTLRVYSIGLNVNF